MIDRQNNKEHKKTKIRIFVRFLFLALALSVSSSGYAQCVGFARSVVKPELAPFVHDGNYNATILGEGESIVLKKTVFEGQKYRLVVKGVESLPGIRFKLIDVSGDVLFDNAKHEYTSKWDFEVQATRAVSVEITILEDADPDTDIGGCLAVLFGLERN